MSESSRRSEAGERPLGLNTVPLRRRSNLSDQVTRRLQDLIASGRFEVGELLPPETAMAREFDVSRTVIREAVARLKAEGLLRSQQGRGVFLTALAPRAGFDIESDEADEAAHLLNILELRRGLDTEAAALAAARRRGRHLAAMQTSLDDMAVAVERGSLDEAVGSDLAFHRAICDATDNPLFTRLFAFLSGHLLQTITASRRRALTRQERGLEALSEHRRIYDAILRSQADAARREAGVHMEGTVRRFLSSGGVGTAEAEPG